MWEKKQGFLLHAETRKYLQSLSFWRTYSQSCENGHFCPKLHMFTLWYLHGYFYRVIFWMWGLSVFTL